MIRVWTDKERAGVLDRLQPRSSTFVYEPGVGAAREVSLTMPLRTSSWDTPYGLAPIFEMNLPEGALRAKLVRQFSKAAGVFDDLDLLGVVGRSQVGRIRYSGLKEALDEDVPLQSVNDILRARRNGGLFDYLMDQFAQHSGLSGVQPKVMVRDLHNAPAGKARRSSSLRGATHIVKFWDEQEYPELAANEFFCLTVAKRAGLEVPGFELSEDGGALVVERFDLTDSEYLGLEDFCVLNGLRAEEKYRGSYETALFKRMKQFVSARQLEAASRSLFTLFVLNCALRNGDAHLKNFGVVYPAVDGEVRLAPVYDVITTLPYVPKDTMALTLEGRTTWPDAAVLNRLGQTRCGLAPREVAEIFEAVADAVADVAPTLRGYFRDARSAKVGNTIVEAWQGGIRESLGQVKRPKA